MIAVRAVITSEFGGSKGYRPMQVERVEQYSIDTAMDTDSDSWAISIGDPDSQLLDILKRDAEVRVNLFTAGDEVKILGTGFADSIGITQNGVLSLSGRDVTAVAVDSQAPPGEFRNVRPHNKVANEAKQLGIPKTNLAQVSSISKIYRDGSETFFEFWYRMYRKKKMYLWSSPDGTLIADNLNYGASPKYFFGNPTSEIDTKGNWIPVVKCEVRKNTQSRIGEVYYFGESDDQPLFVKEIDDSISLWIKRPIKVIFDPDVASIAEAKEEAIEEIFDGKVGSVEIVLQIPYPSFLVQQNNVAAVNLPLIGLTGLYYVVGVTQMGNSSGYVTEVRLREKQFALSRRVPDDPQLAVDKDANVIPGSVNLGIGRPEWSDYFLVAAKQWLPVGLPLDLWLATLLAICEKETGFRNIRAGYGGSGRVAPYGRVGIEWYPETSSGSIFGTGPVFPDDNSEQQHKDFANQSENRLTGFQEFAVGPMQLFTRDYKIWADNYIGRSGEYGGGRWEPRANIWAGARALAAKMQGLPHTRAGLTQAVRAYNGSGREAEAYAADVMKKVDDTYLPSVRDSLESAVSLSLDSTSDISLPDGTILKFPASTPNTVRKAINFALRQIGKPYEWGASGPNTYDCSGLVYRSYSAAGLTSPGWYRGTTYSYWGDSKFKRVSKENLKPGDMVFFEGSGSPPGHMGLYLIDGRMIHAPRAGSDVHIVSINDGYYQQTYFGAKRVVG